MTNYINFNNNNNNSDTFNNSFNNASYKINNTSDGIEIEYLLDKPIEYLPPDTNIILFSDDFNHPVDNLPNGVKYIFLIVCSIKL